MNRLFSRVFGFFILIGLSLSFVLAKKTDRPTDRFQVSPSKDKLKLALPGDKGAIPYKKFGKFTNVGTKKYRYVIKDKKGLANAAGQGIFPNRDVFKDPVYRKLRQEKKLEGNHWNFVDTPTAALNFYKWATTTEDPGVKQFYTAVMMERAGLIEEAIKAFYAVVVHFPKTVSWTYYKTPWYVGPVSVDRIEQLLRRHPEIKMELRGARFKMEGIFDKDPKGDVILPNPGQLVNVRKRKKEKIVKLKKPIRTIGGPVVQLNEYKGGRWKLLVNGKPFPVRAVTYSVTPVGRSPDRGNWNPSRDWQLLDTNQNGLHDGFFESFIDKNGNNQQDEDEPTVGDAQLLKDAGFNTLRAYHHLYDKELFRRLHKEYGLYVLAGDLLGGYATGSGATWAEGTDYRNPKQQQTMLDSVRKMVEEYKDEPYVLMWVLGNENVYGVANNARKYPEEFFELVDRAAQLIRKLDPTRPVVYCNGDLMYLDIFAKKCPNIDVFGANAYRGEGGFGRHFFQLVKDYTGKPVLVTEYGASSIAENYPVEETEAYQALFLTNSWEDMEAHMGGRGVGNALGGVLFEYIDEWWKANSDLPDYVKKERAEWYATKASIYKNLQPDKHDRVPQFGLPFLDGWSYEEWFGLVHVGNGRNSPFVRQLRPAYHALKELWNP